MKVHQSTSTRSFPYLYMSEEGIAIVQSDYMNKTLDGFNIEMTNFKIN